MSALIKLVALASFWKVRVSYNKMRFPYVTIAPLTRAHNKPRSSSSAVKGQRRISEAKEQRPLQAKFISFRCPIVWCIHRYINLCKLAKSPLLTAFFFLSLAFLAFLALASGTPESGVDSQMLISTTCEHGPCYSSQFQLVSAPSMAHLTDLDRACAIGQL